MKTALFSTLLFGLVSTPVHNDRVTVAEAVIQPGAIETWSGAYPSVIVYLTDGSVEISAAAGRAVQSRVKRGETIFQAAGPATITNTGTGSRQPRTHRIPREGTTGDVGNNRTLPELQITAREPVHAGLRYPDSRRHQGTSAHPSRPRCRLPLRRGVEAPHARRARRALHVEDRRNRLAPRRNSHRPEPR